MVLIMMEEHGQMVSVVWLRHFHLLQVPLLPYQIMERTWSVSLKSILELVQHHFLNDPKRTMPYPISSAVTAIFRQLMLHRLHLLANLPLNHMHFPYQFQHVDQLNDDDNNQ